MSTGFCHIYPMGNNLSFQVNQSINSLGRIISDSFPCIQDFVFCNCTNIFGSCWYSSNYLPQPSRRIIAEGLLPFFTGFIDFCTHKIYFLAKSLQAITFTFYDGPLQLLSCLSTLEEGMWGWVFVIRDIRFVVIMHAESQLPSCLAFIPLASRVACLSWIRHFSRLYWWDRKAFQLRFGPA